MWDKYAFAEATMPHVYRDLCVMGLKYSEVPGEPLSKFTTLEKSGL